MMPIPTTVIGSMSKPEYLNLPSWITNGKYNENFISVYNEAVTAAVDEETMKSAIERATKNAIALQTSAGVEIITDGEMKRDSYVYSFCRQLKGIDFLQLKKTRYRNDTCAGFLPRVVGKLSRDENKCFLAEEWKETAKLTSSPLKMTLPGPTTIIDSLADEFYHKENEKELFADIVACIQEELTELCKAGCKHVQIDEPVLIRYPDKALSIGLDMLNQCFSTVPADVCTTVHVCCGYPSYLDQTDYKKADMEAYISIVSHLDNGHFKQLSIEDAHRRNPKILFEKLRTKTIVLGVIDVVSSRVESVDEIKQHIADVMQYIPRERLVIAPDCGLVFLPRELILAKLQNMVNAARLS